MWIVDLNPPTLKPPAWCATLSGNKGRCAHPLFKGFGGFRSQNEVYYSINPELEIDRQQSIRVRLMATRLLKGEH